MSIFQRNIHLVRDGPAKDKFYKDASALCVAFSIHDDWNGCADYRGGLNSQGTTLRIRFFLSG